MNALSSSRFAVLMKILGCCTVLSIATTIGVAASPTSLSGMLYSEITQVLGAGNARSFFQRDLLLRDDGVFVGLLETGRNGGSGPFQLRIPPDGRWTYRKVNDGGGVLTIDGVSRTLAFSGESAGTIPSTSVITSIRFSLSPYESGNPLTNCSNRSFVRTGGTAFTGFVTTSPSRGRLLVRAVGPGLAQFGVSDAIRRPTITVVRASNNSVVGSNSGWAGDAGIVQANSKAGAFPFSDGSGDSALLLSVSPDAYIAQVSSADPEESGQVLIEVYLLP
jgi:hypothetical protein